MFKSELKLLSKFEFEAYNLNYMIFGIHKTIYQCLQCQSNVLFLAKALKFESYYAFANI